MPVQKDIEEGIFQTTLSNEENNDNTHDNVNTINNNEASTQSSMSSPSDNISTTPYDDVSHTLPPPVEDTDQSTLIANHLQNTSYDHTETEPGYTQPQPAVGLVQIHDDNIAPLPPIAALESITDSSGIAVGKKIQGKIEQIEDSTAPSLPATAFDDSDIKRKIALESRIDIVNDNEDAPVPFNMANLDSEEDAKMKSRQFNPSDDIGRGRDSSAIPTSGDLENDTGLYTTITTPYSLRNRDGSGVRGIVGNETVEDNTNSSSLVESGDNNANHVAVDRAGNDMTTTLEQGQSDSIPIIPEAFLVEESEDGVVFDAEPWLPWWKRKRFVGFLLLFAAGVLAIAIGVGTHVGSRNTNVLAAELTPTTSPAPSLSAAPSSSPSECALTVSSNVQKLDMQVDKPFDTKIAIDNSNAVVVTREEGTNNVHIMFYLLRESQDRWERNNQYIEDYGPVTTNNGYWDPSKSKISVALSDRDALVGFPFTGDGLVFAFKQNELGVWEKKEGTLQVPIDEYGDDVNNFGHSIDIDGNLACITSKSGDDTVHVFKNDGTEWKETKRFEVLYPYTAEDCFISGDTIAIQVDGYRIDVYKYDQYSQTYKRVKDSIIGSDISVSFDNDYLIYSEGSWSGMENECRGYKPSGFYVYHRQDLNQAYHQPYVLQQHFNYTDYSDSADGCVLPSNLSGIEYYEDGYEDASTSLSHQNDILAIGGINTTHIFVLDHSDGYWKEALVLPHLYREYRVSERNILATVYNQTTNKDEVYYYNIEKCENTPTQVPSTSTSPSSMTNPTQAPSFGGTTGGTTMNWISPRSLAPTPGFYRYFCSNVSLASTTNTPQLPNLDNTCYSIDIVVAFDDEPLDSVWDIQRVDPFGSNEVLQVSRGTADDVFKLRKESICLTAGVYQFTMHDEKPKGGGLSYFGFYNVSSSGDLIAQGRNFFCNETIIFHLPLTAAPSMMPSETTAPTFSPSYVPSEPPSTSPTISPTVTSQPSPSPSVSFSPTETCYWIDIFVVFGRFPIGTSWQLQKISDSGDYILLETYSATSDDKNKAQNETICLEGNQMYRFTINDRYEYWAEAQGHYNITSDGNLIVQGEAFGLGEITSFSVPFVPGSATLTNVTQEPRTPSPTYQPQTPFPAYSLASPPTTQTPWRLTPFPTDSESIGSSPRPHNMTLAPTISEPSEIFVCPPVSYIGCTAADPNRPEDDCLEVGKPCPGQQQYNEYCCRDACRNYCTSKNWQRDPILALSATNLSVGDTSSPTSNPLSTESQGLVAHPDSANFSTSEVFVSVLDNDTPSAGETLDQVNRIVTQASNGECSISIDLYEVAYFPNPGFTGLDTCVYEACDSASSCDTATLTVIVTSQMTDTCENIMTKKDCNCTKSTSCIWDTTVEGEPECISSEA